MIMYTHIYGYIYTQVYTDDYKAIMYIHTSIQMSVLVQ